MGVEQNMSGGEEWRRTAFVIPPRGRAVLCIWSALPGVFLAPFLLWQGLGWGLVFCALWAGVVFIVWVRACSFVASLTEHTLTIQLGITFGVRRTMPRRSITALLLFDSPLLRLAGSSVLVVFAPGLWLAIPAIPRVQAKYLHGVLSASNQTEDAP
jgi:membrane protein YdbS with pleckstrin-like domain